MTEHRGRPPGPGVWPSSRSGADCGSGQAPWLSLLDRYAFAVLLALLLFAYILGIAFVQIDPPFGLATIWRALYADEGFYVEAAQNYAKFGQWSFPYDFQHWHAAPLYHLVIAPVFKLFGTSLYAARISSMTFSVVTCLLFYGICRSVFRPTLGLALTVVGASSLNFVTYARSTFADPTATAFAMLATFVFVRYAHRTWAIPLTIALGFMSFLCKSYFIAFLAALGTCWIVTSLSERWYNDHPRRLIVFAASILTVTALYLVYFTTYAEDIVYWSSVTLDAKVATFAPAMVVWNELRLLRGLPFFTKMYVFLPVLAIAGAILVVRSLRARGIAGAVLSLRWVSRADLLLGAWLLGGLASLGSLATHKDHYFFFAILPIVFFTGRLVQEVAPRRHATAVVIALAAAQVGLQVPYYRAWLTRDPNTTMVDMANRVVSIIHANEDAPRVPTVGELSAFVGLFSERILPLDAKWVASSYSLCDRLAYWQPRFHVNLVRSAPPEVAAMTACEGVSVTELARIPTFRPWRDEAILNELRYTK